MKCEVSAPWVNGSELRHLEISAIENAVGFFKKFKIGKDRQVRAHLILKLLSPGYVSTPYTRNETNRHWAGVIHRGRSGCGCWWPASLYDLWPPRCPVNHCVCFRMFPGVGDIRLAWVAWRHRLRGPQREKGRLEYILCHWKFIILLEELQN